MFQSNFAMVQIWSDFSKDSEVSLSLHWLSWKQIPLISIQLKLSHDKQYHKAYF